SQNTKRAYWIFKAFATDNETLSLGILTMLTASGDRAIDLLENYTGNTADTAEILNGILCVDRETAAGLLTDEYGMGHEFTGAALSHPR
ncbi:MAG: peptide transporter, partial [Methanothermobacter wolfeii]|nr:peptide transporter [Methanothermobacter wolfeii]